MKRFRYAQYAIVGLVVANFLVSPLMAQNTYSTTSGQKVIRNEDGTWKMAEMASISEDTTGMLTNDLNPMTLPTVEKYGMDENHLQGMAVLTKKSQNNEIQFLFQVLDIKKIIEVKELQLAKAKQMKSKSDEKILDQELDELKQKLKTAEVIYSNATNQIFSCQNLKNLKPDDREKQMLQLGKDLDIDMTSYLIVKNNSETKTQIVQNNANKINCTAVRNEKTKSGRVIELENQAFFSYTPEKLKNYFKLKELLYVSAHLSKEGSQTYLHLLIRIQSKDAAKNYGVITQGEMLKISYISGKKSFLKSLRQTDGVVENYTGNIIYHAIYPIDKSELALLEHNPIDNIGIMWSSGFESYDVYNVDLLMNQLAYLHSL